MTPESINKINKLASQQIPFLFIIDFEGKKPVIQPLSEIDNHNILYAVNQHNNINSNYIPEPIKAEFSKNPVTQQYYKESFNAVINNIKQGNSYLCNLTCETHIKTNYSLKDIFYKSNASYKLLFNNSFLVFSPETFVKINNGKIFSNPMKGTIDASINNAENIILNNKKEAAEHATIVDLIRNDLSRVATDVKVDKYRYIDRIKTNETDLLQVSSQISGTLAQNYLNKLGNILCELLPAGSISGAPKQKTIEIINKAENYQRGYYTGIFGVFDGINLDSGVMIRFIENKNGKLVFKSGGGITINSNINDEYNEMLQKVYLPF